MRIKTDFIRLGEITRKDTNNLSIFSKETKDKKSKISYTDEKISGGNVGDVVLYDTKYKKYQVISSLEWANMPANEDEAIKLSKASDPVAADLQSQIEELKDELNTLKNPKKQSDEGLLQGVNDAN
ncbi:hypothetical protein CIG2463D_1370 [Campylobacter iguaniorum]|uniref:hypothetical protein n=1 Tax=Campylobacter iguaniorum TaxID=1244531 RepID=UPI00073A122D|nr:hypothetical protein [Campylobacter iguaniorum]ALV24938.1 hypothetical protein CIG2463D_1370 [Campylobacter iguaniorum]